MKVEKYVYTTGTPNSKEIVRRPWGIPELHKEGEIIPECAIPVYLVPADEWEDIVRVVGALDATLVEVVGGYSVFVNDSARESITKIATYLKGQDHKQSPDLRVGEKGE